MRLQNLPVELKTEPACPYFGTCGGCLWQDIPYDEELSRKERDLKTQLSPLDLRENVFEPIVPSPEEYRYRSRLDLSFRKTRAGEYLLGFKPEGSKYTVQIDSCAIARKEISDFIPELRELARRNLPEGYKIANLVIKTGGDGRVLWGGMGRRSLELRESDYLATEIAGRKIFYSLDTFFQANLSILPRVIERLRALPLWGKDTVLLDLYSGVGLFTVSLHDRVRRVVMIEESVPSLKLARFNIDYHRLNHVEIHTGKVEDVGAGLVPAREGRPQGSPLQLRTVAIIDPPRKGLTDAALKLLAEAPALDTLLYLSCNPTALAHDIACFVKSGWKIEKVIPFDFFPKTKHLEVLVWLKSK